MNFLDSEDQSFLKNMETFNAIDTDFSGIITRDELQVTFENLKLNHQKSNEVVDKIMNTIDFDGNG